MIATCLQGRAALQKKRLRPSPFHDSLSRSRYFLLRKRPKRPKACKRNIQDEGYETRVGRSSSRRYALPTGHRPLGSIYRRRLFRHSPPATGRRGAPGSRRKAAGATGGRRPAPRPGHRAAAPGRRKSRPRARGGFPQAPRRCPARCKSGSQHRPERLIFIVLWA